ARSVHAYGLDLLAHCVSKDCLATVGEQDRGAIGRVQHEDLVPGREHRCVGAQKCDLLRADRLDIGELVLAERREGLRRHFGAVHFGPIEHDTCSSRHWARGALWFDSTALAVPRITQTGANIPLPPATPRLRGFRLCPGSHSRGKMLGRGPQWTLTVSSS